MAVDILASGHIHANDRHHLSRPPVKFIASGVVHTGPCVFHGFLVGMDGVNNPQITFFDNTAASGTEIVPTSTYDASALGLNGVTGIFQYCENGLYLQIVCDGDVEVTPQYGVF